MGAPEEIRGKHLTVKFDGDRCIHSRNCVLGRPDVFVPNVKGEWIFPDHALPHEVAELAHNCPSGAIQYARHDGGPEEKPPVVNLARVRENGPIAITAELRLQIEGTTKETGFRATLCRCGASKKKPFCDTSHVAAGFVATGEPPTEASEPLAKRNGPVKVTALKNGPLLVDGSLELVSGTGRTINRVIKTALCRCGHSANKPYCDGTHSKVGFRTE